MAATIKIPTVFIAEDKFTAVVKRMTSGVTKFSRNTGAAIQRFDQKISNSFSQLDVWSQRFIGLGAGLIAKSAFDDIRNFEEGLVGVGKTTGTEGQALLDMGDQFIGLSNKMKSISTEKLLELGQVAGQLGISSSKDILNFSSTLAKLEKASDIQGEEGASSIARILTLTGEGVGAVDKFAASLVGLGNTSAATENEILGVTSEVARATATYKLTSTTLLGISTAMKSLDVRPEAAGTAIGKVFRGIEMATISGGKDLKEYAKVLQVSDKEVLRLFSEDKETLFKKFIGGLNNINTQGGSVQKTLNDLGLSGETVSKGIGPLATNYDLLSQKLEMAKTGFEENIALNNEFDAASNTINSALASITNGFSNVITGATNAQGPLGATKDVLFFIGRNMDIIIPLVAGIIGAFILLKVVTFGVQAAMVAYNIALGITGALSGTASIAIGKSKVALAAYSTVSKIAAGAQWLLNAAMTANPIGLIIAGIAALVALIAVVVMKYDEWGAALSFIMGPFGMIINLIMAFKRNWEGIVNAFKTEGIVGGLKKIGDVIMDSLLYPLEQFLGLISKIPGVGKMVAPAMDFIQGIRANLDVVNTDSSENQETIPTTGERTAQVTNETIQRGRLDVNFNDPGKMVSNVEQSGNLDIPILSTTQGQR